DQRFKGQVLLHEANNPAGEGVVNSLVLIVNNSIHNIEVPIDILLHAGSNIRKMNKVVPIPCANRIQNIGILWMIFFDRIGLSVDDGRDFATATDRYRIGVFHSVFIC
ncbi:MAG: hypothetical protein EBQ89_04155, partial [Alphaproteobacteria bacterium]|nr:hypothetical protein [Alphaproteobacteria bacterium]